LIARKRTVAPRSDAAALSVSSRPAAAEDHLSNCRSFRSVIPPRWPLRPRAGGTGLSSEA